MMSKEKRRVPKLRFPGFTEDWEQRKFGDLFEYERPDAYIVKSDNFNNDFNMPVLTANKAFILGYTNEENSYNKPSIIFDDFTLDRKYVDFPYMLKSSAIKILTSKNQHNLRFLFERLNSTRFEVLGHARHYISVVQNTTTLCPSVDEEVCISNLLTKFDELITLHQRKLDNLKLKKKALLQKLFPKNGERYPELRFPGFTDAWEQCKLGSLASVEMNKRIFKEQTTTNGDIPFYKIGTFGSDADSFISRELFEEYKNKYPYPNIGDILISASGSIGRTVVYHGEDAYFQDSNIVWLNHNGKIDNSFLLQFYNQVKWAGLEGSTIKRLYNKNILETNIALPNIEEQCLIGKFFTLVDRIITLHQRKLDHLKLQKKALLQQMFV